MGVVLGDNILAVDEVGSVGFGAAFVVVAAAAVVAGGGVGGVSEKPGFLKDMREILKFHVL